jgi:hypothetical protein
MTVADPDILAVAQALVSRHGDAAKRHAYHRASVLGDDGDREGRALWMQVAEAIDELQRQERRDGDPASVQC